MIKKLLPLCALLSLSTLLLNSCDEQEFIATGPSRLRMLTTTTYLADLAEEIAGNQLVVRNLCGPGVDPHTYTATLSNVQDMEKADVIAYSGVGLEAQLASTLDGMKVKGAHLICSEDALSPDKILSFDEDGTMVSDPHIWNDVSIWQDVAKEFTTKLCQFDPIHAELYQHNLKNYLQELEDLKQYIATRIQEIPEESRVLITVHDAFEYMGKSCGLEVDALKGISTATEAGTKDLSDLATKIARRNIKAIFLENTANPQTFDALQAAVKAKGGEVKLGGELYSDALGDKASGRNTYIKAIKGNIDTIVDALK